MDNLNIVIIIVNKINIYYSRIIILIEKKSCYTNAVQLLQTLKDIYNEYKKEFIVYNRLIHYHITKNTVQKYKK
jgi:hypothetical protein